MNAGCEHWLVGWCEGCAQDLVAQRDRAEARAAAMLQGVKDYTRGYHDGTLELARKGDGIPTTPRRAVVRQLQTLISMLEEIQ